MRRSRVYEYGTKEWDKAYVFAKNLKSAQKKVPHARPDSWSFYARATRKEFSSRLDRFGRYTTGRNDFT